MRHAAIEKNGRAEADAATGTAPSRGGVVRSSPEFDLIAPGSEGAGRRSAESRLRKENEQLREE